MVKFKKLLALLLAVATLLSLAACGGNADDPSSPTTGATVDPNAPKVNYTVELKTQGGMALSGIDIYIWADKTLSNLVNAGKTDENGKLTLQLAQSDSYVAVLSGLPTGYKTETYYPLTGSNTVLTLETELLPEVPSGTTLGVGDVMFDFTVTTPEGESVTLSEVLKEKEMVLLNFWFTTCQYCVTEFPYMEEAYQQYKDNAAVIAVDPMGEKDDAIRGFQNSMKLSFPMAACPMSYSTAFGISGYPTTVLIDRYGVICLIESGGITSLRPFISIFDHFTGDEYAQKLFPNGLADLVTAVKPTYEMDSSENIAAVLNGEGLTAAYRPEEGEGSEFSWPFLIGEKDGEKCVYPSNKGIDDSYSILYADVELKAGQALGFEYLASTESGNDAMFVIVDGQDIYAISGNDEKQEWASCYPVVADHDGTYELALCYIKDSSTSEGDDTVYVKNLHIASEADIDVPTYLPRQAATSSDGFEYQYVDVVLNEKDGFYHVGSENGPLLLADLLNYTEFSPESTIWDLAMEGMVVLDGHDYKEDIQPYASLASNSALNGVCPVDEKLAQCLQAVAKTNGFEGSENEWLKICRYYQAYGTDGKQLENPTKGLSTADPLKAVEGKNKPTNYFEYDRILVPRGLLAEFVPTRSGVYRITSRTEEGHDLEGWIFGESVGADRVGLLTYEHDERMYQDDSNVSMVYYMEAGKSYYIDIAFWDMYGTGRIDYDIEYLGSEIQHFRLAAPGYFTYDGDATGDNMYYLINGGIDVILKSDGYYYEDLGKDANGNQRYGSKLYCDFTGITPVFNTAIANVPAYNPDGTPKKDENGNQVMIKGMIDKGGFDFSKTESDQYILSIMAAHNNDPAETDAYLREFWAKDYESNAAIYQIDDVFAGIYHGTGEDLTDEISKYLDKVIQSGPAERIGCVPVDAELAQILQKLMDKFTFENVDDSWIKLCYYYDYLGSNPNK